MWLLITYTITTPFLMINNYKESRYQAVVGLVVTLIALAVILVISSIYMSSTILVLATLNSFLKR